MLIAWLHDRLFASKAGGMTFYHLDGEAVVHHSYNVPEWVKSRHATYRYRRDQWI
jgi:hypothetical protein